MQQRSQVSNHIFCSRKAKTSPCIYTNSKKTCKGKGGNAFVCFHGKKFSFYYNQSKAVANIPEKREHDYCRRFTDVSSPGFFLREEGTSVHRLPTSCNFKIRVSWLMLSKALLMSKNTAEVNIFWSIALGIVSVFVAALGLC